MHVFDVKNFPWVICPDPLQMGGDGMGRGKGWEREGKEKVRGERVMQEDGWGSGRDRKEREGRLVYPT